MKKNISCIGFLFWFFSAWPLLAQKMQQLGVGTTSWPVEVLNTRRPERLSAVTLPELMDTIYNPSVITKFGRPIPDPSVIVRTSALVIGFINTSDSAENEMDYHHTYVVLQIKYKKLSASTSSALDSTTVRLSLDYNGERGKNYKAKDYIVLEDVQWAQCRLDTFNSSIQAALLSSQLFAVELQLMGLEDPRITDKTLTPTNLSALIGSQINLSWGRVVWAKSYDLEWRFSDPTLPADPGWRHNATRVNLTSIQYDIPLISTVADFKFRVRAKGIQPDSTIYNGAWKEYDRPLAIKNADVFEQDKKVWQYQSAFAEDGMRKDMVSFIDGSSRERQKMTHLNVDGNPLLIAETFYDHQGRPVVQSLPAPFKPALGGSMVTLGIPMSGSSASRSGPIVGTDGSISSRYLPAGYDRSTPGIGEENIRSGGAGSTTNFNPLRDYLNSHPAMQFNPDFNQDINGQSFDRHSFDLDKPGCEETLLANPMNSNNGAGKYYSPANDMHHTHSDYIPDAEGYPFIQVEYTPDNTGRIRRQGKAGKDFQIGSGHDIKYYYSVPSQLELDQLFGNEVGDASKYAKTIMQDENGQLHVSYQNGKGQTIATALTGESPVQLQAIEREPQFENTTNIIAQSNTLLIDGTSSWASQSVFIEQNNTRFNLKYDLDHAQVNAAVACFPKPICYDCPKELILTMKNSCGEYLCHKRFTLGPVEHDPDTIDCESSAGIHFDTTLTLELGEYFIDKTLILSVDAREKYVRDYVKKDTACFIPQVPLPTPCITTPSCIPCDYDITPAGIIIRRPDNNPACKRSCQGINPRFDVNLYETLLRDLMPGGQYGCLIPDSLDKWKVSIFNPVNILFDINKSYQVPVFEYRNPDGSEAWIEVSGVDESLYFIDAVVVSRGRRLIKPQFITDLNYLRSIWQDSWTESLVLYHPEYWYLKWNNGQINSIHFDKRVLETQDYANAVRQGYIRENETIDLDYVNQDPFFNTASDVLKNEFLNKLNQAIPLPGGTYLNIYQVLRQATYCNAPMYRDEARLTTLLNCINDPNHSVRLLSDTGKHYAWQTYKAMYASIKQKIWDAKRTEDITAETSATSSRLNHCIEVAGSANCPPCRADLTPLNRILSVMKRRVMHPSCISDSHLPAFDLAGTVFSSANDAVLYARMKLIHSCGLPTAANDFLTLINTLVMDFGTTGNKFSSTSINLNDIPPLVIPESLVAGFANKLSTKYLWSAAETGNRININITDDRNVLQSSFAFTKTDPAPWSDIIYFSYLKTLPSGSNLQLYGFARDTHRLILILELGTLSTFNFSLAAGALELAGLEAAWRGRTGGQLNQPRAIPDFGQNNSCFCLDHLLPARTIENECERESAVLYAANVQAAKHQRARFVYDSMFRAYTVRCMSGGNERLTSTKLQSTYHYTLFYYDQSGNLTKTVPPKAVRLLGLERLVEINRMPGMAPSRVYAEHNDNLSTTYRYNSLNQKLSGTTPDGGISKWCYDQLGRIILSQDAVQAAADEAHYILYDDRGRMVASGAVEQYPGLTTTLDQGNINYENYKRTLNAVDGTRTKEIVLTAYDREIYDPILGRQFTGSKQTYLRNRISSVIYRDIGLANSSVILEMPYQHATHFSYDISGNVKELVQDFKGLASIAQIDQLLAGQHRFKKIKYRFDLITGNIKEIAYQPGRPDQFYHWYEYDADNRLVNVQTGVSQYEPEERRDKDATYKYYAHGPAARLELGQEHIQGLDLVYTINGWLKNINNPNGADPGAGYGDGTSGLKDALSYELKYYNEDYKAIRSTELNSPPLEVNRQFFNSNISAIKANNIGFGESDAHLHSYRYDQLNRLLHSRMDGGLNYEMNIVYDKNGNITSLTRKDGTGNLFDNLTYHYTGNLNNKLTQISEPPGLSLTGAQKDLTNQAPDNYAYDAKGRLNQDVQSDQTLTWMANDKIKSVRTTEGYNYFHYDAMGRRVYKKTGAGQGEYTVRDFAGNIMAEYEVKSGRIYLNDIPIYAATRIGVVNMDTLLTGVLSTTPSIKRWSQFRGAKVYELKNQVGDINVLVSDRKLVEAGEYKADIRKATDYYPFGMIMPGRDSSEMTYRYGFQGMEQDDNLKGKGNSYSTEFRQYDPRVGRWMSADPKSTLFAGINPYNSNYNNPINNADPRGDCPWCAGAAIGFVAGVAGEFAAVATDPTYEPGWDGVGRVLLATAAGGLTCGLSSLAGTTITVSVRATVVVHGTVGTADIILGAAIIEGSANALAQQTTDEPFSPIQVIVAGTLGMAGPVVDVGFDRMAQRHADEVFEITFNNTMTMPDAPFRFGDEIIQAPPPSILALDPTRAANAAATASITATAETRAIESASDVVGAGLDISSEVGQSAFFSQPEPPVRRPSSSQPGSRTRSPQFPNSPSLDAVTPAPGFPQSPIAPGPAARSYDPSLYNR